MGQTNQVYAPNRTVFSLSTTEIARIQKLFEAVDFDSDGEISREELDSIHCSGTYDLYGDLDLDHDGEVTCYEFEAFFSGMKSKWGEATLDVVLAYLMRNATCVMEGEPVDMSPVVQLFLTSELNKDQTAEPIEAAEFDRRVSQLFDDIVTTGNTALNNGSLAASAINTIYGPANGLFADIPASFTKSAWSSVFDRFSADQGAHKAAAVLIACERQLTVLASTREYLGADLHQHRVVGAVQVFPSRPPPSKPAVTAADLAAVSPKYDPVGNAEAAAAERPSAALTEAEVQTVTGLFDMLDLDGDGSITVEEIEQIHVRKDSGLFEALDLDHDGFITTIELEQFMGTLKAQHGSMVLDIVLQYLSKNASACRLDMPTTVHPIETLFLKPWALPAAVVSPDVSLDAETTNSLAAIYKNIADNGPVTAMSIRAVHGAHSNEITGLADDTPVSEADWIEASSNLCKLKGIHFVSSLVRCLTENISKQESCRVVIESM